MVSKQLVCIIPARGGSKGIKNKNLEKINGKSLIARTIEVYKNSKYIDEVYVSSDSKKILEEAEQFGAKSILRHKNISTDQSSSELAILDFLVKGTVDNFDNFIFAQCTSPLITAQDIDSAVSYYFDNNFDSLFSSSVFKGFIWRQQENMSCYGINHDEMKNRKRRQDIDLEIIENGGFYIINKEKFLHHKKRFFGKVGNYITKNQMLEIDDIEELEYARFLLRNEIPNKESFKYLIMDFDGVLTDNKVKTYSNGLESVVTSKTDSLGLNYFQSSGYKAFIISSEKNEVVQKRAEKLGVKAFHGVANKKKFLFDFMKENKINEKEVIYVGNDMNDLEIFKTDIFCCCPADSINEIKLSANYISDKNGGSGAIRDICERFFFISFNKLN